MSLGPSLRKNFVNMNSADGETLESKIANMKKDLPRYKPAQRKTSIDDILQENADVDGYEEEKELLNGMFGAGAIMKGPDNQIRVSLGQPGQQRSAGNAIMKQTTKPAGKNDLMTSLVSRLSALEKSHKKMRMELVAKDKELLRVKRQYTLLVEENERLESLVGCNAEPGKCGEEAEDGPGTLSFPCSSKDKVAAVDKIVDLESKNSRLRKQVHEMENFLKDYGLVWVGRELGQQIEAPTPEVDFDLFFLRLKELNDLAGDGKPKIISKGKQARFGDQETIPLAVYKDGIMLWRGPFRSFNEDSGKTFLLDVLDGYFPSEFKEKYPDGIVFDFKNLSDKLYKKGTSEDAGEANSYTAFGGVGNQLQSPNMKTEEFLNRLPEKVICGGQVIEIRKGIADRLAVTAKNMHTLDGSVADTGNVIIPDFENAGKNVDFQLRNNEDRVARAARFAAAFDKRSNDHKK